MASYWLLRTGDDDGVVKYGMDCWADKAEGVWAVLQEMGVWSRLWRQPSADGTMVTIMLVSEAGALGLHHYERLSRLVFDGDAITFYPEFDEEDVRQWQEQEAQGERWDS